MAEETILIIQLSQLGDILLTTPCITAIRKERPKARLVFFSHAMGRLILDQNPYLDEHFFYEEASTTWHRWQLALRMKHRRFDLVLDFMNNPRSAFYSFMSGAPERVAFRSARRLAYNHLVPKPARPGYIVDHKFDILRAAGFTPTERRLVLPWGENHTRPVMQLLGENHGFREAPIRVILSPTHRRPWRRWPAQQYAALADRLVQEWQAAVLWLWGPGEEDLIDEAMGYCQKATYKAPRTSFREMAALMANNDVFIGNSNGPSHVAVATDICSLQIHGHTDARSWCPMTDKHQAIQSPEFGQVEMPNLERLPVDAVWDALVKMKPQIETQAELRRQQGMRLNWR